MSLKVGFLGAGPRGFTHARAYATLLNEAERVAIADLDASRRDAFAAEFDIPRRYGPFEEMLAAESLDILHIATSPHVRVVPIIAAAERGIPVIVCEKPIARDHHEYDRMLDACAASGSRLIINHQLRYQTNWLRLREAVESGRLGTLEKVSASCRGNLLSQGTHLLDLVQSMRPDIAVERVIAQVYGDEGLRSDHPAPDNAIGVLLFEDGTSCDFFIGKDAPPLFGEEHFWLTFGMRLLGSEGRAETSLEKGYRIRGRGESGWTAETIDYGTQDAAAQVAFTRDVIRAAHDADFRHPCDARTGRISFEWIEAICLSAAYGVPIRLPLRSDGSGLAYLRERAAARQAADS